MTMMQLEPAYLLHARPYRNTSVIANFFTLHHGRIDGVIRGARSQKSKIKGLVQPFTRLLINWYGQYDLVTIKTIEADGYLPTLEGDAVLYGMYANELLARLIRSQDAHTELYQAYEQLLLNLATTEPQEKFLRVFEKKLLDNLGYGLHLEQELDTGKSVEADAWYHCVPDKGAVKIANNQPDEQAFLGANLLAIAQNDFESPAALRDAKRIMRYALRQLLGDKPLHSRELFIR